MLEKFDILIFRPEIPYCESINVVYFLGEKLFVFSRKFSKTATAVKCPKLMPRVRIQKLWSLISQKEVGFFEIYILVYETFANDFKSKNRIIKLILISQ